MVRHIHLWFAAKQGLGTRHDTLAAGHLELSQPMRYGAVVGFPGEVYMSDEAEQVPADEETAETAASAPTTGKNTPPYLSFTSFQGMLDKMVDHGPPDQIDRDFFGNVSGTVVAQNMGALRFFGLVDERKKPTDRLAELVPVDTRKERLRKLLEDHYPEAVRLGTAKATQAQLDKVFTATGLKGTNTVRKAVTFYLQAAEFTSIPVSPYFSKSRPTTSGPRRTTRKTTVRKGAAAPEEQPTPTRVLDLAEKRGKYIDLLMELAKSSKGAPDAGLLDRLERALEYDTDAKDSSSPRVTE